MSQPGMKMLNVESTNQDLEMISTRLIKRNISLAQKIDVLFALAPRS